MESFFVVSSTEELSPSDLDYDLCAYEYCEEFLDIPSEYIKNADFSNKGLEINVEAGNDISQEDWYIHLERVSRYS